MAFDIPLFECLPFEFNISNLTSTTWTLFDVIHQTHHGWREDMTNSLNNNKVYQGWINRIDENVCIMPEYCDTAVTDYYCNPEEEQQWLLDFYNSTNGEDWAVNTNWTIFKNTSDHDSYCDWYGIRCCDIVIATKWETNINSDSTLNFTKLDHKCLNMIDLDENNVTGVLPNYWPNSSIFTVISIANHHATHPNYSISGPIAPYRYNLPNLSCFDMTKQNFSGTMPEFCQSNCTIKFDTGWSTNLYGTIPNQFSDQKYMAYFSTENTNIGGTIPDWYKWIWPYQILLSNMKLVGTLPNFNIANTCALFDTLAVDNNNLHGTIESFPNTVSLPWADFLTNDLGIVAIDNELRYSDNNFHGIVPFETLTTVVILNLDNNKFDGNLNGLMNENMKNELEWLQIFNITNNKFSGTIPCFNNSKMLKYIDVRENEFSGMEQGCIWYDEFNYFLLSNNPYFEQSFDQLTNNMINMSILALDLTQVYGMKYVQCSRVHGGLFVGH